MSSFFDSFFVTIAIAVFLLVLADWLLGTEGRDKLRGYVRRFWTHLKSSSLDAIYMEVLAAFRRKVLSVGGGSIFSARFVALALAANTSIAGAIIFMLGWQRPHMRYLLDWHDPSAELLMAAALPLVAAPICGWATFASFVIALQEDIAVDTSWRAITLSFLSLLGRILVIAFVVLAFLSFAIEGIVPYLVRVVTIDPEMWDSRYAHDVLIILAWAHFLILTMIWPVFMLPCLLFLLSILKIAQPVLQPVAMLLLDRLHQSEKGVLSQISIGLGGLAKLIQEITKFAS